MHLSRFAREYYELQITTTTTAGDPIPPEAWEASFDDGATWSAATVVTHGADDWSAWLLDGPDVNLGVTDPPTSPAVAIITHTVVPVVRVADSPEIVVRRAPTVTLG